MLEIFCAQGRVLGSRITMRDDFNEFNWRRYIKLYNRIWRPPMTPYNIEVEGVERVGDYIHIHGRITNKTEPK